MWIKLTNIITWTKTKKKKKAYYNIKIWQMLPTTTSIQMTISLLYVSNAEWIMHYSYCEKSFVCIYNCIFCYLHFTLQKKKKKKLKVWSEFTFTTQFKCTIKKTNKHGKWEKLQYNLHFTEFGTNKIGHQTNISSL